MDQPEPIPTVMQADVIEPISPGRPAATGLRITQILLTAIILLLLAGVIPTRTGGQEAILRSPLMVTIGAVLFGLLIWCLVKCWQRLGFILLHTGVALILVGAGIGWWFSERGEVMVPLDGTTAADEVQLEQERRLKPGERPTTTKLPHPLTARDFVVDYYDDPSWHLVAHQGSEDLRLIGTYPLKGDVLDLGPHGRIPVTTLQDADGTWKPFHNLGAGLVLQRTHGSPRHFQVDLKVGNEAMQRVMVNHPVSAEGWRYYLMSWDQQQEQPQYVVLTARRDPGRSLVIFGIWLAIAGSVAVGLRALRRSTKSAAPPPTLPAGSTPECGHG